MGQYHYIANLDRGELISPHTLGTGLKLWEQLANHPGTGAALIVLLASASNGAGGGDLRSDSDVIGSWRGDRIAMVGDYDDDSHYDTIDGNMTGAQIYDSDWTDISLKVCGVIEEELGGKFAGDGWRRFTGGDFGVDE
jgi:hypothetical protein